MAFVPNSIITLTTDFGLSDPFAGIMKGVILSVNPKAHVVDITHGVSSHDILAGSMALQSSYSYFPKGTIHVAVVDPGVGSSRRPLLAISGDYAFVGPDNGLLAHVIGSEQGAESFTLRSPIAFSSQLARPFTEEIFLHLLPPGFRVECHQSRSAHRLTTGFGWIGQLLDGSGTVFSRPYFEWIDSATWSPTSRLRTWFVQPVRPRRLR